MVKYAVCLTLFAAVSLAANLAPRHEGHDHEDTSVAVSAPDAAAAETGAGHNNHEEPSATETGEAAESTSHSHEDGESHSHGDQSVTDTSSPTESTSPDAEPTAPAVEAGASTTGLTWSLAVSLVAFVGYLI